MSAVAAKIDYRFAEGRFNFAPGVKVVPTKFLTPGLVSYKDQRGGKVELLRKETIDAALATLEGNPVTLGHIEVDEATNLDFSNGHTTNPRFNAADGWFWCDSVVETDQARQRINSGEYPSCGYEVLSYGPGGVWQNMRYEREITAIRFNHMAIVPKPRYTDSTFRLNAITPTEKSMNVFKLIKSVVSGDKTTKTEHQVDGASEVEIDGVMVRLNDLGKAWMDQTAAAVRANGDDEVMIEGCDRPVKLNELKECYKNSMAARRNETEAAEKKKKDDEAAAKKETERMNALSADERAKEEQKKKDDADAAARKNALEKQAFDTLQGARFRTAQAAPFATSSGSLADQIALGAKRY